MILAHKDGSTSTPDIHECSARGLRILTVTMNYEDIQHLKFISEVERMVFFRWLEDSMYKPRMETRLLPDTPEDANLLSAGKSGKCSMQLVEIDMKGNVVNKA